LYGDLRPQDRFPLDRLWIVPTNRLAGEINQKIQEWTGARARDLRILREVTQLVTPTTSNLGLDEGHQIDLIENLKVPTLHSISFIFMQVIHARD
jgi:hypothetical protein